MRRVALVGAGLVAALWLLVLIGGLFGDDPGAEEGSGAEGVVLAVLVVCGLAALALGVVDGRRGGLASMVVGVSLGVFAMATAGRNHLLAVAVSAGPFLLIGALLFLDARRR